MVRIEGDGLIIECMDAEKLRWRGQFRSNGWMGSVRKGQVNLDI